MPTLSQRYYIEHMMLPFAFYLAPNAILRNVHQKGLDYIADCYNYVLDEAKDHVIPQNFETGDFGFLSVRSEDGHGYSIITPPEALAAYDCQMIGIANCGGLPVYGTIERTAEGLYALCSWDSDHSHHFYSIFEPDATWEEKSNAMQQLLFREIAA